jgi:hypothetical protein
MSVPQAAQQRVKAIARCLIVPKSPEMRGSPRSGVRFGGSGARRNGRAQWQELLANVTYPLAKSYRAGNNSLGQCLDQPRLATVIVSASVSIDMELKDARHAHPRRLLR